MRIHSREVSGKTRFIFLLTITTDEAHATAERGDYLMCSVALISKRACKPVDEQNEYGVLHDNEEICFINFEEEQS
jgi:hypothetical protein